jgi:hypothetical protein
MDLGIALAITGAAVFSIHTVYTQHAGTLSDARTAPSNDPGTRQRLTDADLLTGGLVLLVGGGLAGMTGKPHALVFAVAAFAIVALYYHGASRATAAPAPQPAPTNLNPMAQYSDMETQSDYTPTDAGTTDYTYDAGTTT